MRESNKGFNISIYPLLLPLSHLAHKKVIDFKIDFLYTIRGLPIFSKKREENHVYKNWCL